jgi:hypothetical protein
VFLSWSTSENEGAWDPTVTDMGGGLSVVVPESSV